MTDSARDNGEYMKKQIESLCTEFNVKLNVSWTDYYSSYRILVFVIDYYSSDE